MSVYPYIVVAVIFLAGLAGIVTSRNLIHLVVCVSVAQSSTYVLLLAVGYRSGATAPIFQDVPTTRRVVDPIVQALTLTDVVVGVRVSESDEAAGLDFSQHGEAGYRWTEAEGSLTEPIRTPVE